jgi:hypothetical protein
VPDLALITCALYGAKEGLLFGRFVVKERGYHVFLSSSLCSYFVSSSIYRVFPSLCMSTASNNRKYF